MKKEQTTAAMLFKAVFLALLTTLTSASPTLSDLARSVTRVESIREIKDIQRSFAHYLQFGRWAYAASLFAADGTLTWGNATAAGVPSIETWLRGHAGAMNGIQPGTLNTYVIETPVISLSEDGESAKGRWNGLRFAGDGKGGTLIEGGIYENEYVRGEKGWRIQDLHYYALYEGPYGDGWRNVGGRALGVVPYHFTAESAGSPIPPVDDEPEETDATFGQLDVRVRRMNDEDEVRNLMHSYGFYVDRRMWTDVQDLHTRDTKVTITDVYTWHGKDGVRQALERMGPEGLTPGVNNDHPIFDMIVEVNSDGKHAIARGIEIAMVGNANNKSAHWEFNVFRNNLLKEDGVWKVHAIESTPLVIADYYKGWGDGGIRNPGWKWYVPPMAQVENFRATGIKSNNTGPATPSQLADLERRLRRSAAYDGSENNSHAYGYYADDINCQNLGDLFAAQGHKASPFAGFFITPQRITDACLASYGTNRSSVRSSISFHWRPQPVIIVSEDGRSASLRARLLQPSTSVSKAGYFNSAIYQDQVVLEDSVWRLWSVTIDEFYWTSTSWAEGWSNPKPRNASQPDPEPAAWTKKYPPDLTLARVGEREATFRAGSGKYIEWPEIQRMWFGYRNPVSGRTPEWYWEGCVPCKVKPEWSLEANGYQEPPTGPVVNGTSLRIRRKW